MCIILILLGIIIIGIFLFIRNEWTYNKLIYTHHNNKKLFYELEGYYKIFFKFWIWDIEKFKRKDS